MDTDQPINNNNLANIQSPQINTTSRDNDLEFGDVVFTWTTDQTKCEMTSIIVTPTRECNPDHPYDIHIIREVYTAPGTAARSGQSVST